MINGGSNPDHLLGGQGDDVIEGGAGNDGLVADSNIWLEGGPDDDRIYGHDGDDDMYGMGGYDKAWGGNGTDYCDRPFGAGGVTEECSGGNPCRDDQRTISGTTLSRHRERRGWE